MRVKASEDEWFPVYELSTDTSTPSPYSPILDVNPDFYAEWKDLRARFYAINQRIADRVQQAYTDGTWR